MTPARNPASDEPLRVEDDGLYLPEISDHSLRKIRVHNRYARMFTTAMRSKWDLAYVGLYSGAGRALVKQTGEIVETSALSALRQPHPFAKYIFVDREQKCTDALTARWPRVASGANVEVIQKDVNASIAEVRKRLPVSRRLLTFCFIDPFNIQLEFETIRQLSDLKIDFLILLMLSDPRRNFERYRKPTDTKGAKFIDAPNWREEFTQDGDPLRFVWKKFDRAMQTLGYPSTLNSAYQVNVTGMGVLLYLLAFYSKDEMGLRFWQETTTSLAKHDDQGTLAFPPQFKR